MERPSADISNLLIPRPPIPMPGDKVFWYNESLPFEGELLGHNAEFKPVIQNNFGNRATPDCFEQIRLLDPTKYVGPNWGWGLGVTSSYGIIFIGFEIRQSL